MTDTTETPSAAPVDDVRAHNKNLIFAALAEAGIHSVTVGFDGSGDSGQIEDVEAWNHARDRIPLPSDRKVQITSHNPHQLLAEISLEAAIEELAWNYLEETHEGWENNDGAYGTFYFYVPDRTITLEHNERFTDVNTHSHQF
jgi:hypothetical protein